MGFLSGEQSELSLARTGRDPRPVLSLHISDRGNGVLNYALRRLLTLPVVLFALSIMLFALQMSLSPTQRLAAYAPSPDFLKGQESIRRMIEQYGLNDPFHVQYGKWIGNIMTGNLGWSRPRASRWPMP